MRADQSLLHKSYNATSDAWTPSNGFEELGEVLSGPPKAVSDGPDYLILQRLQMHLEREAQHQ